MGRIHEKVGNRYVKRPEYCRGNGCHNPPALGRKYCQSCSSREREKGITDRLRRRMEIMELLGGIHCAVPGCPICDPLMLEIDHKQSGGSKWRANYKGNPTIYLRVILKFCRKNPIAARRILQVLCGGHNKQKETYRARGWKWTPIIAAARNNFILEKGAIALLPPRFQNLRNKHA